MMKVVISIVAYTGVDMTEECLRSVLATTRDHQIILSINGNVNMLTRFKDLCLRPEWQRVELVWYETNHGFQIPHLNAFRSDPGDFFVLLNNDTIVESGWLESLMEPFSDPLVALSGHASGCCSLHQNFHGFPGKRFEYLEGSLLACRSSIIKQEGLFSPYLEFAYGEDSDLSLRMRRLGYRLARTPIPFKHFGQKTSRMVQGIKQIQDRNHAALCRVWSHYLKVRTFEHPILIRRRAAIGDVLLVTPILKALRKQRPLSKEIYVETDFPELFDRNPNCTLAAKAVIPSPDTQVINLDMVYEVRVNTSILDAYADKAGVTLMDHRLIYTPSDKAMEWAERKLNTSSRPRCIMHHGPTTWVGKNWPTERFGAISNWLMANGWDVIQIGAGRPNEIDSTLDLRSKTSIDQSAALLAQSQLFVGLDSFPLHLAMSQGCPAVGVFGATLPQYILSDGIAIGVNADPTKYPCVGERHRVVGQTHVDCNGECIRAVGTEMVKASIEALIGIVRSHARSGIVTPHDGGSLPEIPVAGVDAT